MVTLLKRWVRYSVVRKGGSSPMWTAIGVLSVLNTLRKRYAGPKVTSILADDIRPGEVIEIRHTGKPSKEVRSERAAKAAMLAQLQAAVPASSGRSPRRVRSLRKQYAGTVIDEMARGKQGSTTAPVTDLLGVASTTLAANGDRTLSRRQLRKATKAARKTAKRSMNQAAR